MSANLEIPSDIPWKRMGASKDMIDEVGGDLQFPEKWRSSIAVFYHEPKKKLPPEYENRRITYLKIVCTLTNLQLPSFETLGKGKHSTDLVKYYGEDTEAMKELRKKFGMLPAWKAFEARITDSFPCYGALLQVTVFPSSADPVAPKDFPYIVSFQPRKREMYEVTTESGEVLSKSDTKLNITHGATSTKTVENYDLDLGYSASGNIGLFDIVNVGGEYEKKQVVGDIQRSQDHIQDVRTTDTSKNKAESYSHTTNLNELYSLLQGYHLGTNRALFFMQPRPHIQDTKFTFIRGIRRLEGIQEFFLVINRPTTYPGLCVEVALETAHSFARRAYRPRIVASTDLNSNPILLNSTARALQIDLNTEPYKTYKTRTERWNQVPILYRHVINEYAHNHKFYIQTGPTSYHNIPQVASWCEQTFGSSEDILDLIWVSANYPRFLIEDAALVFEEYEADDGCFFLTSRQLCCCNTPSGGPIDLEESLDTHISSCGDTFSVVCEAPYSLNTASAATVEGSRMMTNACAQNNFFSAANHFLASSLGSEERSPYGEVTLLSTDFVMDELAKILSLLEKSGVKDVTLKQARGFKSFIDSGLGSLSKAKTLFDCTRLSTEDVSRDMGLSRTEAKKIRRELLVKILKSIDQKDIPVEAHQLNPIVEDVAMHFPKEQIDLIRRSAGLAPKKVMAKASSKKKKAP